MATYYYEPYSKTFHNNIVDACATVMARFTPEKLLKIIGAELWNNLMTAGWCKSHPEESCEYLGIYRMRTRTRLEVKIRFWLYRTIAHLYDFQWVDVSAKGAK